MKKRMRGRAAVLKALGETTMTGGARVLITKKTGERAGVLTTKKKTGERAGDLTTTKTTTTSGVTPQLRSGRRSGQRSI
jgi:hypothetical protein